VKHEREAIVEIKTAAGLLACRVETKKSCLELRIRNLGQSTIKLPITHRGEFSFVHAAFFAFEGQRSDGQWENFMLTGDTYDAPREFLTLESGQEGTTRVPNPLDYDAFAGRHSNYRVELTLQSGQRVYSGPLELGPSQ